MINMIKMDLFRLFKTKSMYIILVILAACTILFSYFIKESFLQIDAAAESAEAAPSSEEPDTGYGQHGIRLVVGSNAPSSETSDNGTASDAAISDSPAKEDSASIEEVTLLDMLHESASGMLLGLFLVIFTVLFATSDITSGFIKNIGGQVSSRSILILSKTLPLLIYTIILFAVYIVVQAIAGRIFFGYIKIGNIHTLADYLALQILLHFALALLCMMLAILIKNNVVTMIIAVLLCAEIPSILFRIINKLIGNLGVRNFDISKYSLTQHISTLGTAMSRPDVIRAVIVGVCFAIFSVLLSCFIFKKRDIA